MEDNFSFQNAYATYNYQDGILYIEFKPEQIIDLEVAKFLVKDRITVVNKAVVPVMIVIKDDYLILEPKAVRFLNQKAGKTHTAAQAIVVSNPWLSIKTNWRSKRLNSKVKSRVFTKRSAAKLWLMNFLNYNLD